MENLKTILDYGQKIRIDTITWGRTGTGKSPKKPILKCSIVTEDNYDNTKDFIDILSLEGLNKSREVEEKLELKIKGLSSYKNIQKSKELQEWTEDPTDILASMDAGQPNKEAKNLINNMKPLGEPMILYRGVGVSPEEIMGSGGIRPQKGTVLPLDNFTSASRGPDAALYYAGTKGTLLILEASEDIPGISISNLDVQKYFEKLGFEEEGWSETILNYGLEFEILDVDYEGKIPVIKGRVKFKS